MKSIIIAIIVLQLVIISHIQAQHNFLENDYLNFGRKEPATLGSLFSSLGAGTILVNPANIAMMTDNRISVGAVASDMGSGYFISWTAPNVSISSAEQKLEFSDTSDVNHQKQLFHFNFGISTNDLGIGETGKGLAIGLSVKRQADRLNHSVEKDSGGSAVSIDVGFLLQFKPIIFEFALIDCNNAKLDGSQKKYSRGFLIGTRFTIPVGLTLALQGISGDTYAESDFGLNMGAEQAFFDRRLITRLQLTSFFSGSEATMQNISSCIGYRFPPDAVRTTLLEDIEFCYALSFLSMPKNVGTHMLVISKYF